MTSKISQLVFGHGPCHGRLASAPLSAILPPGMVTTVHFSQASTLSRFALTLPSFSATTYFPCQDFRLIVLQLKPETISKQVTIKMTNKRYFAAMSTIAPVLQLIPM